MHIFTLLNSAGTAQKTRCREHSNSLPYIRLQFAWSPSFCKYSAKNSANVHSAYLDRNGDGATDPTLNKRVASFSCRTWLRLPRLSGVRLFFFAISFALTMHHRSIRTSPTAKELLPLTVEDSSALGARLNAGARLLYEQVH